MIVLYDQNRSVGIGLWFSLQFHVNTFTISKRVVLNIGPEPLLELTSTCLIYEQSPQVG